MQTLASPRICFVIGDPVSHSLSPALHNFAYQKLGISNSYVYSSAPVPPSKLAESLQAMRTLGIRGFSVTLPHKENILPLLDDLDPLAKSLSAVNTVLHEDGKLIGYNTDALGILRPIKKRLGSLRNKRVLVYGAGGVGRTAALSLRGEGALLSIVNRKEEKGRALAQEVNGDFYSLEETLPSGFDLIIQASSLGLSDSSFPRLVPSQLFHPGLLAFESVYTPLHTQFVKDAEKAGAKVILGSEMFAEQACAQMSLFTGKSISVEDAEKFVRGILLSQEEKG